MAAGFVYLLTNETMPGIVKIGKTRRLPENRSNELYTTGVALPFKVRFAIYSEDMDWLEQTVHEDLEQLRVSSCREFFYGEWNTLLLRVVDVFLGSHDSKVEHVDFAIDPGDHARYANICGVCTPDLIRVLDFITPAAWKAAAAELSAKQERMRERRMAVTGDGN